MARPTKLTNEQQKMLIVDYKIGTTARELGKGYGIGESTVLNILVRNGIKRRKAARQRNLILPPAQHYKIIGEYNRGLSELAISKLYGTSRKVISGILTDHNIQRRPTAVPYSDTHRICYDCGKEKLLEKFAKSKNQPQGRVYRCKSCMNKYQPRRKYGLSHKDLSELMAKQHSVCAICGQPETMKRRGTLQRLAIDHDHKTGKVRGLLCSKCNSALGYFNDNIGHVKNAFKYLKSGVKK